MKIELEELSGLIKALDSVPKNVRKQANKEIAGAALRTVGVAKMRLQPKGSSRELAMEIAAVRQSINFKHEPGKLEASVFAGNTGDDHMAAYLEFGTGKHAAAYVPTLPGDFQKLARTFLKNGKGTLGVHSYLIPAYLQEGKRLGERLKNLKIDWTR